MGFSFVHCSDIHLGKGEDERRVQDFIDSFEDVINTAVDEKVDAFLIAGDLFDMKNISPPVMVETTDLVRHLVSNGIIPVLIEGNHDRMINGSSSWSDYLSEVEGAITLKPSLSKANEVLFEEWSSEKKTGSYVNLKGYNIYGAGYPGFRYKKYFNSLRYYLEKTKNNILLLHAGCVRNEQEYLHILGAIPLEDLLPIFKETVYTALGHIHSAYCISERGDFYHPQEDIDIPIQFKAFNPGAPETLNISEANYKKGFFVVSFDDAGNRKVGFRRSRRRPVVDLKIENQEYLLDRITMEIENGLKKFSLKSNPVLRVNITGSGEVDQEEIRNFLGKRFSPLRLEINDLTPLNLEREEMSSEDISVDDVEREVLKRLLRENNLDSQLYSFILDMKEGTIDIEHDEEIKGIVERLLVKRKDEDKEDISE